jgi:glycosyltransferase involved in cell wall biosynthesis
MNEPRRILHVIRRLDGYGAARMLRYLAASQAAAGEHVMVAALSAEAGPVEELASRGVDVHVLGSRWAVDPVALVRLERLKRRWGAELLHAWDLASLAQSSLMDPRARGREALVASLGAEELQRRWAPRVLRAACRRGVAIAVDDQRACARLLALCGSSVHGASLKPAIVPPGVPAADVAPPKARRLRAELGLPEAAMLIATAGPLRRRKMIDEAIWCFELVRVLHDEARMLVIGDGPDRPRLERFAEQVSEPGSVRFLGFRVDLASLWQEIDVYWQLDAAAETPCALLEALAAGVPAVASDVPALRAVVDDRASSCLAPVGSRSEVARATDGLITRLDEARQRAAAAAPAVLQRWSLEASLAGYRQLYQEAVAAGRQ